MNRRNLPVAIFLVLLSITAFVGLTWADYQFALQNPGGSDFLVHWVGTRALILDGTSPYSDTVALQIQVATYGRPARPGEHELRPAYPLYSALLFAPFASIGDYATARAFWMTFLQAGLLLLAVVSLRLANWRPAPWLLALYLLFALLWYHGVRPVINGNAVVWVALFLALALLALRSGRDELAGALLAFATIKPHLAALIIAYVCLWAISQRRWKMVGWFLGAVLLLTGLGMIFVLDWPLQNLREILRYTSYNPPTTPGAAFAGWWPGVGRQMGWVLTAIMVLMLLVEWWLSFRQDFRRFLWTACLTLVAGQWIGITTDPGNFLLLFLPMTLVFAVWDVRWGAKRRWMVAISMLILFFGLWALFLSTIEFTTQPMQNPVMFFPLPLFLLITLYWVRWWAIRPQKLLVETLKAQEA